MNIVLIMFKETVYLTRCHRKEVDVNNGDTNVVAIEIFNKTPATHRDNFRVKLANNRRLIEYLPPP